MDLYKFLSILKVQDDLLTIKDKISTNLEIACVTRYLFKTLNKALLFKGIRESNYPVLTNVFGSKDRIASLFGLNKWDELYSIGKRLLTPQKASFNIKDYRKRFKILTEKEIDLTTLPNLIQWDKDQNPYISMATTITVDPKDNAINSGIYRIEIASSNLLWLYSYKDSDIAKHIKNATQMDSSLLCSIAIGAPPLFSLISALKMPKRLSEFDVYISLKNDPLQVISFKNYPVVPYTSMFIIFGKIIKTDKIHRAQFGNFTGNYNEFYTDILILPQYLFIAQEPLYQASIVSLPPSETSLMFKTSERLFLPVWKRQLPEIQDILIPEYSGFNQIAIIWLKKSISSKAKDILDSLKSLDPPFTQRLICLVDDNCEIEDIEDIIKTLSRYINNILPLETPGSIGLDLRRESKKLLDIKEDEELAKRIIYRLGIHLND